MHCHYIGPIRRFASLKSTTFWKLQSFTQENAAELKSVGSLLTPATMVEGKHTDSLKQVLCHCLTFPLVIC
jgi:hypothetical protein